MNEIDASVTATAFRHIMDRLTIMMGVLLDILKDEEVCKEYEKKWTKLHEDFDKELDEILEGVENGK